MTKYARIKFLRYAIIILLALAIVAVVAFCGRDSLGKDYEDILYPVTEDVYTLADGTSISSRPSKARASGGTGAEYLLPNGLILLETEGGPGPINMEVDGVGKLSDLSDEAQAAIRAYFEEQGLLYDLNAELERVYGDYIAANYGQDSVHWNGNGMLQQYTLPTGGDDDTICFTTSVLRPHTTRNITETRNETIVEYAIEEHTTCFRKSDGSVIPDHDHEALSQP